MNAKSRRTDLALATAEHDRRLKLICEDTLPAIFAEVTRIHKRLGNVITVTLMGSSLAIYHHKGEDQIDVFDAGLQDPEQLISLLEKLEGIGVEVYELVEEGCCYESV